MIRVATWFDPTESSAFTLWLMRLMNVELFILVIVSIVWDPKNVLSFIIGWFVVKA